MVNVPITRLTRLELSLGAQMDLQVLPEVGLVHKLLVTHDTFDGGGADGCRGGGRLTLACFVVVVVTDGVDAAARIVVVVTARGLNFHDGLCQE